MTLTEKQIDNRIRKLETLKAEKKEIEKAIEATENEIKNHMQEMQEIETSNYKIKWTLYTSKRFDSTAFKKKHEMLYNKFVTEKETRRFSYKKK